MLRLKEIMQEKGVTQMVLAEKTGIPQSTISRWYGNKVDAYRNDIIDRLCEYLEITPGELIVRVEKETA